MNKYTLFVISLLIGKSTFGQVDTALPRWGIAVNATGLIDILQEEEGLRIAFEYRLMHKKMSLLIEPGMYFEGSGYNFKMQIKKYRKPYRKPHDSYFGLAFFNKSHTYSPSEQYYKDSSRIAVTTKSVFVIKNVSAIDCIVGAPLAKAGSRFWGDMYLGLGIRFKNISGITEDTFWYMEDWFGGWGLLPGKYVYPDLSAGVRVGINFYRRKQNKLSNH